MISVARCRELLGPCSERLDASQIELLRDQLYEVARCLQSLYVNDGRRDAGGRSQPAVEAVEERGPVLESNGSMIRDEAMTAVLSRHPTPKPS